MRPIPVLLRLTLLCATAGLVLVPTAQPARAGGSGLSFEKWEYRPGETARASGLLSITDSQGTGWIDDGPYLAYLIESEQYSRLSAVATQHPFVPAEATRVGEARAAPGPSCCSATFTLEFVVPALPRGHYAMLLCNDPCTDSPGDYTGGGVAINAVGAPPLTEPTAPDAAAAARDAATDATPPASLSASGTAEPASASASLPKVPESNELQWWWPVAGVGLALLVIAGTIRRTRTQAGQAEQAG